MKELKRKQIYLPEELDQKLADAARKKGVSQSEVIRESIEKYLLDSEQHQNKWAKLLKEMEHSRLKGLSWDREEVQRTPMWDKDGEQ